MRFIAALLLFMAASAAAETSSISVGANLALTGKLAFTGDAQLKGLTLAVEHANNNGGILGRKIVLQVEDNGGDPKLGVSSIRKQLEVADVRLFYVGLTHIVQAVKQPLAQHNALVLYGAAIPEPAAENQRFFRDWGDPEAEGEVLIEGIAGAGGRTTVFLGEENDSCHKVRSALERKAEQTGVRILASESYNPGETDFRSILLRLTTAGAETISLCAFRDSGTILRQLKSLGRIKLPVYHTLAPFIPANDTAEMRLLYEENGSVTSWFGFVPDDPHDLEKRFIETYRSRFGEIPRIESALAYDDLLALVAAARSCSSTEDLVSCAARKVGVTRHAGVLGELVFDQNRKANRVDFLMRVEDGKWRKVVERITSVFSGAPTASAR